MIIMPRQKHSILGKRGYLACRLCERSVLPSSIEACVYFLNNELLYTMSELADVLRNPSWP